MFASGVLSCYNPNMDALRYKPAAFYPVSGNANDYSGYARNGTIAGSPTYGLPLAADTTQSLRGSNSIYLSVTVPNVYTAGREKASFSLSAIVYPVLATSTGSVQVASHPGIYDGLSLNGTVVTFSTYYQNTGQAKASYDLGMARRAEIIGVHTATKNSLYVDGVLVAEVDITSAQQADVYLSNVTNNFSIGYSNNTNMTLVNNVGFFPHALQTEQVASLYRANTRRAEGSVPKMFGGEDVLLSTVVRPLFLDSAWTKDEDWKNATLDNVTVDRDQLTATMYEGLTLAGQWTDSVDLYTGLTPVAINSVNMWWEGVNETVTASIDNINWSPVVKGQPLSIIPTGFDPTDKDLYIRVSFPAGVTEAWVDSIQINGYTSNTAVSNNRVVTYTNPTVPMDEKPVGDFRDDWGVRIGAGGSVSIAADLISEAPMAVRTVEIWVKKKGSVGIGFSPAFTQYTSGDSNNNNFPGEWVVYFYTFAATMTGDITISGDCQLGKVAIYDSVLTQTQMYAIIANYTGVNKLRFDGTGTIGMSESATPAVIYAHDWEITAS